MNYFPNSSFLALLCPGFCVLFGLVLFSPPAPPWKKSVCQHLFWTPVSLLPGHKNIGNRCQFSRSHLFMPTQGHSSGTYHVPLLHTFSSFTTSYQLINMLLPHCKSIIPLQNFLFLGVALFFSVLPVTSTDASVPFDPTHHCMIPPGFWDTTLLVFPFSLWISPLVIFVGYI